jgi:hypothetical protein
MEKIVFVYSKNDKIRALSLSEAQEQRDFLLKDGYKHTATIDPCLWIENLVNGDGDDAKKELNELVNG